MALAVVHHTTAHDAANLSSYSTVSITPGASRLLVACYASAKGAAEGEPENPSGAGNGLAWVQVDSHYFATVAGSVKRKQWIFAAFTGASPTTGAITFDHGVAQIGAEWSVFEITGIVGLSAANVAQAFRQFVHSAVDAAAALSGEVTLAAAGAAANRAFLWSIHEANEPTTPRTNWAEIGDNQHANPTTGEESQWRSDAFEATASASWATSSRFGLTAFEIQETISTGQTVSPTAIASAEAFGTPALGLSVAPISISSAEAFGLAFVTPYDILSKRNGFAEEVTGGLTGSVVHVTNNADSGAGSLRAALEHADARWVVFDGDYTITLSSPIQIQPNKTIDARGRTVTIKSKGIYYDSTTFGSTANLIFLNLIFDHAGTSGTDDAVRIWSSGAAAGADRIWVRNCTFRDGPDGLFDLTGMGGQTTRVTIEWCRFGPDPGPISWADARRDGKVCLIGDDPTDAGANKGAIRVTFHHNLFEYANQRQPKVTGSWGHIYNNLMRKWGKPDGTNSVATEGDIDHNLRVINNIYDPYNTGDLWRAVVLSVASVDTAGDTLTVTVHGLVANQKVRLSTTGTLPAPLVADTDYFVRDIVGNTFKLAATSGGVAIDLTGAGSGVHSVHQVVTSADKDAYNSVGAGEAREFSGNLLRNGATIGANLGTPFTIPYSYVLETADTVLENAILAGAGAVGASSTQTLSPTGITSGEAIGIPAVDLGLVLAPTGIPTEEAVGTPTVIPPATTLLPTAISSEEALGVPAVAMGAVTLSPVGIASLEALGAPAVQPGAVLLSPVAIPSQETLGTPAVTAGVIVLSPTAIASLEAFGLAVVTIIGRSEVASPTKALLVLGPANQVTIVGEANKVILEGVLSRIRVP